jgi:membrane fusion protein, heavy metal efflux system
VTVRVAIGDERAPVALPPTAIQTVEGEAVVFVPDGEGLRARPVHTGRSDDDHIEVLAGLEPGERYVARGA